MDSLVVNNKLISSAVFKRNYLSQATVVVNQGGSSAGKTYAIVQVLFCLACQQEDQIITVVAKSIPNLKSGALRDALTIYNLNAALSASVKRYYKTDRLFEFYNGSSIEFKSYTNAQEAKSGKRDYLFVN